MSHVTVVVGGQYGSEAKGAATAHLAKRASDWSGELAVIRVAGPNAGHTAYDGQGREWKLRSVPVAAVTAPDADLYIAAGSEIDPVVLAEEITALEEAGHKIGDRLHIHPSATLLMPRHVRAEQADGIVGRIGSTGKGIGAARADRINRTAEVAQELYGKHLGVKMAAPGPFPIEDYDRVIIEGTQGYGLGLHTPNYPQVTSSDCRAIDFLAMAGISPWDYNVDSLDVLIVVRCFPIRVAGNSGPLKNETTWQQLGLPEERTTVTNKVRRVGSWDPQLVRDAIRANGGGNWNPRVRLALTMVDQMFPQDKGVTHDGNLSDEAREFISSVQRDFRIEVAYVGTSPTTMFEADLP